MCAEPNIPGGCGTGLEPGSNPAHPTYPVTHTNLITTHLLFARKVVENP